MNIAIKIAASMFWSLVTESFVKSMLVRLLREGAKKTKTRLDDQTVEDMARIWKVKK